MRSGCDELVGDLQRDGLILVIALPGEHVHAVGDPPVEDRAGELLLERAAQVPLERPRAELGIEALTRQPLDQRRARPSARPRAPPRSRSAIRETDSSPISCDLRLGERLERDDLVDPVQELGQEGALGGLEHALAGRVGARRR